eukprot:11807162-Alexandrium_andersonii.AAC.1
MKVGARHAEPLAGTFGAKAASLRAPGVQESSQPQARLGAEECSGSEIGRCPARALPVAEEGQARCTLKAPLAGRLT